MPEAVSVCGQVPQICFCGCAVCDGRVLSPQSTAALVDGEMDLGGKQEGRVCGRSDWCERGEAARGKGVRRRERGGENMPAGLLSGHITFS